MNIFCEVKVEIFLKCVCNNLCHFKSSVTQVVVHSTLLTNNTWLNTLNVGACMKFTRVLTKLQFMSLEVFG